MEIFFLRSKLFFLLQAIEVFLVRIANSEHDQNFIEISENYIGTIYRAARDFSESLFISNISVYEIQLTDSPRGTMNALRELNSLLIIWLEFKSNRLTGELDFHTFTEEQHFINFMITIVNRLTRFRFDFERLDIFLIFLDQKFVQSLMSYIRLKILFKIPG